MSKQFYTNLINPNLTYNSTSGSVTNPLTASLDAGQNNIINLADPVNAQDAVNLEYLEAHIPSTDTFIENPLTATLNANNYSITNLPSITLKDTVESLTTYQLLLENGSVVCYNQSGDDSSALMHIAINEGGTSRPYFTDFRGHPISNVGSLTILSGGTISGSNSSIQINCPLDVNNNYIKDIQNMQFFNGGSLEMDLSNNLLYNDSIVVTANNIGGYISAANWEPNAASDLNMTSHDINFTTGNVILDSGDLILNNSFPVSTDADNDFTFDENKVVVCQPPVLGTIPMVDSTPGSAIGIEAENPILFSSNSISKIGILNDPIFEVELEMVLETVFPIDPSQTYVVLVLSTTPNPLNSTPVSFCKFSEGFNQLSNGNVVCKFRTDQTSPYLQMLESWADAVTAVNSSNFYLSICAQSVSLTNPSTNYINVLSSTATVNVITGGNQFLNNEIVNVNGNCKLQTYNVTAPVPLQANGTVTIDIFDYSGNVELMNSGSFYLKGSVVATNLCIKFSAFVFDNNIVSSSGSQSIVYQDASFVSCGLYLNAGVLSVQIAMNSNLDIQSMCKVKTKIVTPI